MIDPLEQTEMTSFITDNGYEWAFLYFRALLFNDAYDKDEITTTDQIDVSDEIHFVRNYWGSIVDYMIDIDYDTLAELFEYWCNDEMAKLSLPVFTDITVVPTGSTDQLIANTIYLCTDSNIDAEVVTNTYSEQLQDAMAKVNVAIKKKVLFSEFQQGDSEAKIHQYERWLDVALLADMHTYIDSKSYDRLGIFVDLMTTEKACWVSFRNTYSDVSEFHSMKFRKGEETNKEQLSDVYDESNYKKTDLKNAFDRIDKFVKQGRGLIHNVGMGKMGGVR